ncbi:MAG: stage III sporulation protein AB [Clostridia bacterium]|nr:stage III sporulation protein AB [Clostridia bacterium]MBR2418552.1 stage III sporulation protein AB [Clostridia bacterium]
MKLSGAGIIWICLTVTGFRISVLLKKRTVLLEKTVSLIINLKVELSYRREAIPSLFRRLSDYSVCRNLDYLPLCEAYMQKGEDFPTAWKKSIAESRCPYTAEEKSKLSSLGEVLGTTDTDSQITMLNLYEEYMKDFLNKAEKSQSAYGRLSLLMGFLLGFAVFILVL